jgi:chemotaxis protein histidine kinase CheA
MRSKQTKRRKSLIFLSILGVILLAAVAVAAVQWDTIKALVISKQYSDEDLGQMLADDDKSMDEIINKLPGVAIYPLTEDNSEKLRSGDLTEEEAIALLLTPPDPSEVSPTPSAADKAEYPEPTPAQTEDSVVSEPEEVPENPVAPEASETPEPEPSAAPGAKEAESRIAQIIAQIYILRENMTSQLESVLGKAKTEYKALPKAEQTKSKKIEVASKYLSEALTLEQTCDGQVNDLLAELNTLLVETGGDASVVEEIRKAYKQEKALKKSYYINLYS